MSKKCCVEGCNADVASLGGRWGNRPFAISTQYCRKHTRQLETYGAVNTKSTRGELEERFWRFTANTGIDKCWVWLGSAKSKSGYGSLWDNAQQKSRLAHRVSYELFKGSIPDDKLVMHTCDNPRCVNPNHLMLGTHKENGEDKSRKGRAAKNVFKGEQNPKSKLTLEQVRFIRANTQLGHKEIADMWGLSPNCVRGVRIGRTWKGIE